MRSTWFWYITTQYLKFSFVHTVGRFYNVLVEMQGRLRDRRKQQ